MARSLWTTEVLTLLLGRGRQVIVSLSRLEFLSGFSAWFVINKNRKQEKEPRKQEAINPEGGNLGIEISDLVTVGLVLYLVCITSCPPSII